MWRSDESEITDYRTQPTMINSRAWRGLDDEITYCDDIGQGEISEVSFGFRKQLKMQTGLEMQMQMQEVLTARDKCKGQQHKAASFKIHAAKIWKLLVATGPPGTCLACAWFGITFGYGDCSCQSAAYGVRLMVKHLGQFCHQLQITQELFSYSS